jgi:hypothetical protein
VPTSLPGVEPHLLDPIKIWANKAEFDKTARALVGMFQKNFGKFEAHVDADVRAAGSEARGGVKGSALTARFLSTATRWNAPLESIEEFAALLSLPPLKRARTRDNAGSSREKAAIGLGRLGSNAPYDRAHAKRSPRQEIYSRMRKDQKRCHFTES